MSSRHRFLLCIAITSLLFSCNNDKVSELKKQNDTLVNVEMKDYGRYLGVQNDLKIARDSIKLLQKMLHPPASANVFAFVAMEYSRSFPDGEKKYTCVGDINKVGQLNEEDKYRWMDSYSNSFLQKNNIFSDYSIIKRQVYTFSKYVDASKKREYVYQYGIDN